MVFIVITQRLSWFTLLSGNEYHGFHCYQAMSIMVFIVIRPPVSWFPLLSGNEYHGLHCYHATSVMVSIVVRQWLSWFPLLLGNEYYGFHCYQAMNIVVSIVIRQRVSRFPLFSGKEYNFMLAWVRYVMYKGLRLTYLLSVQYPAHSSAFCFPITECTLPNASVYTDVNSLHEVLQSWDSNSADNKPTSLIQNFSILGHKQCWRQSNSTNTKSIGKYTASCKILCIYIFHSWIA